MAWFYGQLGFFLPYKWSYNSTWIILEPARVCGIEFMCFFGQELQTRWLFQRFLYVHPENWGNDPIWRSYLLNGLKPPTSRRVTAELDPLPFDFCRCSLQNCMKLTNPTFATARWWLENMSFFSPRSLGRWSNLFLLFRCGWNHQLAWFKVDGTVFYGSWWVCASCVSSTCKNRTGRARFKVQHQQLWHDWIPIYGGTLR